MLHDLFGRCRNLALQGDAWASNGSALSMSRLLSNRSLVHGGSVPAALDKAQLENLLENQKDITELYQELSYEELTDVLNTWLNPDDTSTESGTQTEASSVVAETAKVEDASAAFDELVNK